MVYHIQVANLIKFGTIVPLISDRKVDYLDLSCGRCNDAYIWSNRVKSLVGIDVDRSNIAVCGQYGDQGEFMVADLRNNQWTTFLRPDRKFQLVSMQFALHYFCDRAETIKQLLTAVSEQMAPGGRFVFSIFDGQKIDAHLQDRPVVTQFSPEGDLLWQLEKKYQGSLAPVGQEIAFTLNSLSGFRPSREYLVNLNYLEGLLNQRGLLREQVISFDQIVKDQELYRQYVQLLQEGTKGTSFQKKYTGIDFDAYRQQILSQGFLLFLASLYQICVFRKD